MALKIFPGHTFKVILVAGSKIIPCPEIPIKYLQSKFLFILAKQYGYRCKIIWFFRNLVEAKFTKRHPIFLGGLERPSRTSSFLQLSAYLRTLQRIPLEMSYNTAFCTALISRLIIFD